MIAGWKECHFDCAAFSYFQLAVCHTWKHDPKPSGSFILPSHYSLLSRLAMYTVSAWLSMQCSSFPSPYRTTTNWDQAFLASILVLYLQDNVSSSSLDQEKMAKSAELSITGQARPDSSRDMGNWWLQTAKLLSSTTTKKSSQGLSDKYCSRLISSVDMLGYWYFQPDI